MEGGRPGVEEVVSARRLGARSVLCPSARPSCLKAMETITTKQTQLGRQSSISSGEVPDLF